MTADLIPEGLRGLVAHLRQAPLLLAEAEFGARAIFGYLEALPPGASVLEIGSGPGILLAAASERFPQLSFTGVEPIQDGFSASTAILERLSTELHIDVRRSGYEMLEGDDRYDVIFLINVFEHLPDWRHFLGFVERRLAPRGRCVVYCPNYGFPYESHFYLPIIGGKRLTGRVFAGNIARQEAERGLTGLWHSLNFVTWGQVRRGVKKTGLRAEFDPGMLSTMIGRLDSDAEFRKRQGRLGALAGFARRSGLLRLLQSKPFWGIHPYMHFDLLHR